MNTTTQEVNFKARQIHHTHAALRLYVEAVKLRLEEHEPPAENVANLFDEKEEVQPKM